MSARRIGRRVHPNSLAAYASVDLARRQGQVLDAITDPCRRGWRPCDRDVANFLGWPINFVTPRRGELVTAGRVVRTGNKIGESGRKVACWWPAGVQLDLCFGAARSCSA